MGPPGDRMRPRWGGVACRLCPWEEEGRGVPGIPLAGASVPAEVRPALASVTCPASPPAGTRSIPPFSGDGGQGRVAQLPGD